MKRIFIDFLEDILQSINDIEDFSSGQTFDEFISDKKTVLASLASLQIIGEASNKVPQDVREIYPEIPWKSIIGLRNKIVHEYFGLHNRVIWEIIHNELPQLKPQIIKIIEEQKDLL
ncbi:MAG: DUF86 domain-containing protein [Bacteroidota bacterium]|nr:DUF86 domain-containing protein [Bacteroidota bacterium]